MSHSTNQRLLVGHPPGMCGIPATLDGRGDQMAVQCNPLIKSGWHDTLAHIHSTVGYFPSLTGPAYFCLWNRTGMIRCRISRDWIAANETPHASTLIKTPGGSSEAILCRGHVAIHFIFISFQKETSQFGSAELSVVLNPQMETHAYSAMSHRPFVFETCIKFPLNPRFYS